MPTLTLTAKRQATFPKETCDALRLRPGDVIELEKREENGQTLWLLKPQKPPAKKWMARLTGKVKPGTDHSIAAIRKSIAEGRKREERGRWS